MAYEAMTATPAEAMRSAVQLCHRLLQPFCRASEVLALVSGDCNGNRIWDHAYHNPADIRKIYPDYGTFCCIDDMDIDTAFVFLQVNHFLANDEQRLHLVERSVQHLMQDFAADRLVGKRLHAASLVGARVAFFTMDVESGKVFDEFGEEVSPGSSRHD